MLEAHHLTKRYFGSPVVKDVNFAVCAGEILGYLGPNGSGKSTTIRMLAGLLDPSVGRVTFRGIDIQADPVAFRRVLGYVPEEPHLYPFLSGREQLELVGRLREMPAALLQKKMAALLELFGMADAAEQPISAYSKGMRQKILIIGALLHDPELLVLDEPDSGLDVTATLVLRHLVRNLAARGRAVLYSSHVLEIVERVSTSVIVLHRGEVVAHDSVARLRELMSSASLEEVFSQLVLRVDPARTAQDIADVVSLRA